MLQTYFGSLYYVVGHAEILRKGLENSPTSERLIELRTESIGILQRLSELAERMSLMESVRYIERMHIADYTDAKRTSWILESCIKIIENEADQRLCYIVQKNKSDFLQEEGQRWLPIGEEFPSINSEAKSALFCYVVSENTACIFHLMRIAEIGLRALARERRVKIPKKPLDWTEWQEILTHLGKKVDEIAKKKRGPAKDAALMFYQGALGEFSAFKDTYRNMVMHVRKSYDEHEAASALLHVREFMGRLGAKLGENEKNQIKWGHF